MEGLRRRVAEKKARGLYGVDALMAASTEDGDEPFGLDELETLRELAVQRVELDVTTSTKPVVGGINGVAVGAGLGLAMATDVRLVARSARLMAGYTRIGGSPDAGLTITLPQAMGYEKAMRFMMENRTLLGEEAVAWGMAGEVVDDAAFAERLAAYCQQLCEWSPITLRLLKRGVSRSYETTDLESQLRFEVANIGRAFRSEDGQEARRAFLEKRKPVFQGR